MGELHRAAGLDTEAKDFGFLLQGLANASTDSPAISWAPKDPPISRTSAPSNNVLLGTPHASPVHVGEADKSDEPYGLDGADGPEGTNGADDPSAECEPPLVVEEGGIRWVRTDISRGADLVNGQGWITEYNKRLLAAQDGTSGRDTKPGCLALQEVARDSDLRMRNRVLRDMAEVSPPGRKVQLPTGQDVIFWFNVGAPGPLRERVYVTEARCPHQHACLLKGELMEVEDLAGAPCAMIRCPRHNKRFSLATGESPGNVEALRRFPCCFENGRWYVGVGPAGAPGPRPSMLESGVVDKKRKRSTTLIVEAFKTPEKSKEHEGCAAACHGADGVPRPRRIATGLQTRLERHHRGAALLKL